MVIEKIDINNSIKKEALRRGYSLRTIKSYQDCAERFFKYCKKDVGKVSKVEVREYLDLLVSRGKSGNTINVYLNALKFFFENCLGKKMKINIKYSKKPVKLPRVLSKEELRKLFDAVDNSKHKLMLQLMYGAGFRVSELVNLKVNDLNINSGYGYVRQGKAGKIGCLLFLRA